MTLLHNYIAICKQNDFCAFLININIQPLPIYEISSLKH